jgi:PhnB protein
MDQFAPQIFIDNGVMDVSFYTKAFGAVENFVLRNDDGSVHVAELSIDGAIFHIHEISQGHFLTPEKAGGITALIGLITPDVDAFMKKAVDHGAIEKRPARDNDYYRQGTLIDPFGHEWLIEKKL